MKIVADVNIPFLEGVSRLSARRNSLAERDNVPQKAVE